MATTQLGTNTSGFAELLQRMRAARLATSNGAGQICSSADGRQHGKGGARLCNGSSHPGWQREVPAAAGPPAACQQAGSAGRE